MRRKTINLLTTMAALGLGVALAKPRIEFYLQTGHLTPIREIETLQSPVAVTKWSSEGLHLADGRTVQLPGLRSLPSDSAALAEVTKRGVEVHADGRVWGLVRVQHWCGCDPVREHVARVDLSDMMMFLRVGDPDVVVPQVEYLASKRGGWFSKSGWRIDEFLQFEAWESSKSSGK
jgi:hypothetical protein